MQKESKRILAVFLTLGDSVQTLQASGQWDRFRYEYLEWYARSFDLVYVFSYGMKGEDLKLPENSRVIVNSWKLHRYLYTFIMPFVHRKILRTVTVTRTMQATGGIPTILARLWWNIPAVVTYGYEYATFASINRSILMVKLTDWYVHWVLGRADAIIVTTERIAESLKKYEKKVHIIPNGVNLKVFREKNFFELTTPARIISIGRLNKQKQFDLAIRGLTGVKEKVQLVLVGRGELEEDLKNLAKQVGVSLEIIPPVPHSQVPNLLKEADMYLHTSVTEGHPKALLEAMAVGLPTMVCSSQVYAYEFIDPKSIILVEPAAAAIGNGISSLLKDGKKRQQLGKRAREEISSKYDLERLLLQEIKLLQDVSRN